MTLGPLKRFSKLALESEKELILKAPWGKLSALSWGDPSHSPVLLCHGRLDSCSSFRPLVQRLPRAHFYVSVDLPGNGRSDHYPRGGSLNFFDFVPPLEIIRDHFKWEKFTYIGHSLGAVVGKYLNHIAPNQITRMVDIDPQPAYLFFIKDLRGWYQIYSSAGFCGSESRDKVLVGPETAPKYTYDEILEKIMKARGLSEDKAVHVLERCLEPTGDGLYRLTFDQRFKFLHPLPFLYGSLQEFYTAPKTPTLGIFATDSIRQRFYKAFPFALDESAWKHGNYRHVVVEGGHDIHLQRPEEMGRHITKFMADNPE
ncbi:unnamed protein product [Chilo suppressalis]|uniref:AB hydrolase-1 domain-containing protein n=1 Tax=Chilo suppressalis TaxID=168631 RepID=A0ABN8B3Z4_CHISP|nr:unnamed protein product [Chilo suppressalis]